MKEKIIRTAQQVETDPLFGSWRRFFLSGKSVLAQTHRAMQEGKALELLKQSLVGHNGIEEMHIEHGSRENDVDPIRVVLIASRSLSLHETYSIWRILHAVKQRFGVAMHVVVSVVRDHDGP
jgi:hypothetical protein